MTNQSTDASAAVRVRLQVRRIGKLAFSASQRSGVLILLFAMGTTLGLAAPPACPTSMSPAAEAKLRPVLNATQEAIRSNNWSDKSYEDALDRLLGGKDDASIEARVALMDYPIAAAYAELLTCTVATGGERALHYLELYSRCDVGPSQSPVSRDHSRTLRSTTLKAWKAGDGKGSCESE